MKARTTSLGLFILIILVFNDSMAQKANITTNGGLTIGFGGGMAYQKSDLVNSKGFGFDFTLGSQLYQKENAFLAVDWKFRFLAGQNKAYDHRINPDDTYSNIRYSFFNYDLELGLTLNRLRERTGIVLTGFVGAGITHGRTYTDLYDAGGSLYDYGSIDPNRDKKLVYDDLVALSDGDFETSLVNKAAFLPTTGLFLGYQLSRSLTIGIEYKTNFYLTEENSFAGIDLDNRAYEGSGIDRNNYVSLGFGWKLGRGSSSRATSDTYSSGLTNYYSSNSTNNTRVVPATLAQPAVNISDPSTDPFHTESQNHTIRATIVNVSGPENISFYQNGFPNNNFTYNVNTLTFTANVRLREGENSVRIEAANQTSTAEDAAIITLVTPEAIIPGPSAEFTSPSGIQFISSIDRIEVIARVKNVSGEEDIQFTLNGRDTPFEYYPYSGLVKTNALLNIGDNNLFISGSNESGSAQDQLAIYFDTTEIIAPPMVQFTNPMVSREVNNKHFPLSAQTQNVFRRNDVELKINGASISNFSFSDRGEVSVSLVLLEGINSIEIIAANEAGFASDRASLTYNEPIFYVPVYNEPVRNEPVYKEPVRNEPVRRERVSNDPVRNEPVRRERVSNDPARRDPVRQERVRHERVTEVKDTVVVDPCNPPTVSFNLSEVDRSDATHELRGTISGVKNKSEISLTLDGRANNGFQFVPSTGDLSAKFKLTPGSHTIVVSVNNECGSDSNTNTVSVSAEEEEEEEEEECGIRINPGNSDWQFCLVTPSGTYSRQDLTNKNFSYSGSASSLYFKPIGGGGEATVNGRPYSIKSGQYYLFSGRLNVSVSTKNPGSMGQWSVCIDADRAPVSGNGNNRPKSPCEAEKNNDNKGNGNRR